MSLSLLDWRRTVAALYADVRRDAPADPEGTLARFRAGRDRLFAEHPDSPLDASARAAFRSLPYWPHDPALRFEVEVEPLDRVEGPLVRGEPLGTAAQPMDTSSLADGATGFARVMALSVTGETFPLRPVGRLRLPVGDLTVYWIEVYGGGIFVPFRDATAGATTYGAGRYVLDTIKGADLGGQGSRLVVDFNYAYHPSCAYDPRWSCPLAPPENHLTVAIEAGERLRP